MAESRSSGERSTVVETPLLRRAAPLPSPPNFQGGVVGDTNVQWPARNLHRFFLLDIVHQWLFMVEHGIKQPAMTLSPSVLVSTMLMCCYAVGKETLDASVEDVQRATLLKKRGIEIIAQLDTGLASILRNLRAFQGRDFLRLSHSIWIPGELPFENDYAIKVARSIGAQVFLARDISSTSLRTWAQGQLQEHELKCSFPDVSPSEVTILSLFRVSATWSMPFEQRHTESHTLVEDSRVRQLDLMVQRGEYAYHEGASYRVISLPTDGPLECLFILPTFSLADLLSSLSQDYKLLFSPLTGSKRLVLKLPRFRVTEGDDICGVLAHALIFRRLLGYSAQYTGMSKARTYIRHIIHKVFLHVTEDGINAVSTTPPGAQSQQLQVQPSEEVLEFSKSFVFMVRDRMGCDVLLATVVNGSDPLSNSAQADTPRAATPPLRPVPNARAKQHANEMQPATQDAANSKDVLPTLPDGFRLNQLPLTPRPAQILPTRHYLPPLTPKSARSMGHHSIASPRSPAPAPGTAHVSQNGTPRNSTRRPPLASPRSEPQQSQHGELLHRLVRDMENVSIRALSPEEVGQRAKVCLDTSGAQASGAHVYKEIHKSSHLSPSPTSPPAEAQGKSRKLGNLNFITPASDKQTDAEREPTFQQSLLNFFNVPGHDDDPLSSSSKWNLPVPLPSSKRNLAFTPAVMDKGKSKEDIDDEALIAVATKGTVAPREWTF